MLSKIQKTLTTICMVVVIGLLTCGFTYEKSNPDFLQFTSKNDAEVILFTDKQDLIQSDFIANNENQNLEIGQIIVSNGMKEVVFAIGTDGSYITIPAAD